MIDGTTWGAAETEFSAYELAFSTADIGASLETVLGRVAFESRSQIIVTEGASGSLYKYLFATNATAGTYEYTASGVELTEWLSAVESTRELLDAYNDWRVLYALNRYRLTSSGGNDPDDFFDGVLFANTGTSDFTGISTTEIDNAQKQIGLVPRDPLRLLTITDATTAIDAIGFYIAESMRVPAATVELIDVPWVEGYALELGDVVELQLDWWSATRGMRVLGLTKNWARGTFDVTLIEVNLV